jgi:hypothetical protein
MSVYAEEMERLLRELDSAFASLEKVASGDLAESERVCVEQAMELVTVAKNRRIGRHYAAKLTS